jgi:hypothetical protein
MRDEGRVQDVGSSGMTWTSCKAVAEVLGDIVGVEPYGVRLTSSGSLAGAVTVCGPGRCSGGVAAGGTILVMVTRQSTCSPVSPPRNSNAAPQWGRTRIGGARLVDLPARL